MPKCKSYKNSFIIFSVSALRERQREGFEYPLCSNRFSSNKSTLKGFIVVLYVNSCRRRPKQIFFFFFVSISPIIYSQKNSFGAAGFFGFLFFCFLIYIYIYTRALWFVILTYYQGFRTLVQFLAVIGLCAVLWNVGLSFLNLFVEWIIFLSDLTGEIGWRVDWKKKHKLLTEAHCCSEELFQIMLCIIGVTTE